MRITEKQLKAKVAHLNNITDNPSDAIVDREWQIGCYCLSFAYGGVGLEQIMNDAGGVHNVLRTGHVPKRELAGLIDAFIAGIYAQKETNKQLVKELIK